MLYSAKPLSSSNMGVRFIIDPLLFSSYTIISSETSFTTLLTLILPTLLSDGTIQCGVVEALVDTLVLSLRAVITH